MKQFLSHAFHASLYFLLHTRAFENFSSSPIDLVGILESGLLFDQSINWKIKFFGEVLITHGYVFNYVVESNGFFGSDKDFSSRTNLWKLVLKELKSVLVDRELESIANEDEFGLKTIYRAML